MQHEEAQKYFTPGDKDQVIAILSGKCPHNEGFNYIARGHNSETWGCLLCGEWFSY